MRRMGKFLALMLIAGSVTACGNSGDSAKIAELEAQIAELQAQLNQQGETAETDVAEETAENKVVENEVTEEPETGGTFQEINYGDTIELDFVIMNVLDASVSDEVKPKDTSGVYSYMSDKDGEKYFYLKIDMENVSGDAYGVDDMVINFIFDDKYNYSGYVKACDGGNDFYGDYLDPFDTTTAYLMASIPDKLIDSYSKCAVQFGFKDDFSGSYYDDMEECKYLYQLNMTK